MRQRFRSWSALTALVAVSVVLGAVGWIEAYPTRSYLPSQTGNSGKFLTTNGTTASWGTVSANDAWTGARTIGASFDVKTSAGNNFKVSRTDGGDMFTISESNGFANFSNHAYFEGSIRLASGAFASDIDIRRTAAKTLTIDDGAAGALTAINILGTITGTITLGTDLTGASGADITLANNGIFTGRFHTSNGTKPDCTPGAAAGASPSCTVTGSAERGLVAVTNGGSGTTTGTWFTLAHASSYTCPNGTSMILYPANNNASAWYRNFSADTADKITCTTSGCSLVVQVGTPTVSQQYDWQYSIGCF